MNFSTILKTGNPHRDHGGRFTTAHHAKQVKAAQFASAHIGTPTQEPKKHTVHDLLNTSVSMRKPDPKKGKRGHIEGLQPVPMDAAAIQSSLTQANS